MEQNYTKYNAEDQEVWNILFERQKENLQNKACEEYLKSLDEFEPALNPDAIPQFRNLDEMLLSKTGWKIEVVPGLIPVDDFFLLLSEKRFCSSTWLRKKSQLDYLEEPDMFHDIFGHTPLLLNPEYADFVHQFGILGKQMKGNDEVVKQLQRLYWFTIEFGLMKSRGKRSIYGAGIASSFGESNHIFEEGCQIFPFDMQEIIHHEFRTDVIQSLYYELESLDQLYSAFDEYKISLK